MTGPPGPDGLAGPPGPESGGGSQRYNITGGTERGSTTRKQNGKQQRKMKSEKIKKKYLYIFNLFQCFKIMYVYKSNEK